MNIRPEVLRRWALHQIRRATPTVFLPEQTRRERLLRRKRQLDHAASLADYYRSRGKPRSSA